jgi:hypothetical protein
MTRCISEKLPIAMALRLSPAAKHEWYAPNIYKKIAKKINDLTYFLLCRTVTNAVHRSPSLNLSIVRTSRYLR